MRISYDSEVDALKIQDKKYTVNRLGRKHGN